MKISPNTENPTSLLCLSSKHSAGLGIFCGILMLSLAGCSADSAPEPQVQAAPAAEVSESTAVTAPAPEVDRSKLPTVAILATGGTIAGTGDVGRATNYKPGQLIVSAVKFKSLHKDHPTALTVSNVGLKQLKFANDFKSSLGLAHSLNSEAKVSLSAGSDGK